MKVNYLSVNICVAALILTSGLYYLWSFNIVWLYFLGYIFFFRVLKFSNRKFTFILAAFFLFLFFFWHSVYQYGGIKFGLAIIAFLPFLLLFIEDRYSVKILKVFIQVYAFFLVPSVLNYIMVTFLGIKLPYTTIEPLNELKDMVYYAYPFMVSDGMIRFHAYFDEPGVVGTFNAILLIATKFNVKDWKTWIIFIAGVFSFSKFFYILIISYLVFCGDKKNRFLLVFIVMIVIAFMSLSQLIFKIDDWFMLFNIDEEYHFQRTGVDFELVFKKFMNSPNVFWGLGRGACSQNLDPGGSSYQHVIVDSGIIMFMLYVIGMGLFYLSKGGLTKKTAIFFVLFLTVLYQRPFINGLVAPFLMIAPICFYLNEGGIKDGKEVVTRK